MATEQNKYSLDDNNYGTSKYTNVVWSAVIAGAILSLAYEVLFNFLGIGLGFTSFNLDNSSMFKIGISAIIWLAISGIISMGIGGWFTGSFTNIKCRWTKAVHGLLAWGLATLLSVMLASIGMGSVIGGAVSLAGNNASAMSMMRMAGSTKATPSDLLTNRDATGQTQSSTAGDQANTAANDTSRDTGETSDNLGKAFIIMFIAFVLSGVASAIGAAYGSSTSKKTNIKDMGTAETRST
ncbi:MAG: hypothetical protein ACK5Z5_00075 [Neisseriaceae bacterium]